MDGRILVRRLGNSIVLMYINIIITIMSNKKIKQNFVSLLILATGFLLLANGFPNSGIAIILTALTLALSVCVKSTNKWGLCLIVAAVVGVAIALLYFLSHHDWISSLVCIIPAAILSDIIVKSFRKLK